MKKLALMTVFALDNDGETEIKSKIQNYSDTPFSFGAVPVDSGTGLNLFDWTLAVLPTASAAKVANDPDIVLLPAYSYDTQINALPEEDGQALWAALSRFGIDINQHTIEGVDSFGVVVERIGRILDEDFSLSEYPLAE